MHHLRFYHHEEYSQAEAEATRTEKSKEKQGPMDVYLNKPTTMWSKTSDKWKQTTMAIAKWCVKDTRPNLIVEDEGFRRLMGLVCPTYEVPCANTIANYIDKLAREETQRIKSNLEEIEFVAMTTDGGSSTNARSFQEVGVHGITEDFELLYHTLGVREVKEEHTAANYRKNCDKILQEFGVKEKVVLTTTDNENKMRLAFHDEERNGCLQHIVHSSLTEGLTKEKAIDAVVLKQRKIISKHNKSHVVKYGLEEAQKDLGIKQRPLIQDVPNRWVGGFLLRTFDFFNFYMVSSCSILFTDFGTVFVFALG